MTFNKINKIINAISRWAVSRPLAVKKYIRLIKSIGMIGASVFKFQELNHRFIKTSRPYRLTSKEALYPLLCRPHTSDIKVFDQIFVQREYSCLDALSDVGLVIDCGANVGYSTAYFLSRFPNCNVIAVEPDSNNFNMMAENLKPYGKRAVMLHSAIWSHPASLTMSELIYRDGAEWSRQVRECKIGEKPLFTAIDIGSLLKESKKQRISILKMDIEGAEGVVFSSPTHKSWIDKVDTIAIELHDDSSFGKCSEFFFSAISKEDFEFSRSGELTVCKSLRSSTKNG